MSMYIRYLSSIMFSHLAMERRMAMITAYDVAQIAVLRASNRASLKFAEPALVSY
jgi:hypothetical protein